MIKHCVICEKEYKTYRINQKTCSRKCMSINQTGCNNPNYGNKWSDEQRHAASVAKKELFKNNPDYAYECGKANRGVKFSEDRILAMHINRTPESYVHYPNEGTKKLIGKKSKEKWTPEFKDSFRKTMEDRGHWIPKATISHYKQFYKDANWIGRMIEYFDKVALENLKLYGIFNKNNPKGWVRDHIVSRKLGYEYNLPPYILRHPANLQFISHAANISKGFSDRSLTIFEKERTIEELLDRIVNYDKMWFEQEICLLFIIERRKSDA